MNEILGIAVPADLGALSSDELRSFARDLRAAAKAAAEGDVDPSTLSEIKAATAKIDEVRGLLSDRDAADAALAAEREALLAELGADDPDFSDETDEGDEPDEDEDAEAGEDEGDEDEGDEPEAVTASAYRPRAAAIAKHSDKGSDKGRPATAGLTFPGFKAKAGVPGFSAGQQFGSANDLGQALIDAWNDVQGSGGGKVRVAYLEGKFAEEQQLTDDYQANVAKFGGVDPLHPAPDALTAAICAPRENIYESVNAVTSSTARPVWSSLAKYRPARGGVSLYPTPKLSDITDGRGIWDRADDANAEAVKEAAATITCGSPENYDIYGIYRSLTVKNMMQLTYPELVLAYLNRLEALQASLGEVTLLDGMLSSVNLKALTATANDFGATINLFSTILNLTAIAREEERLGDQMFDCWLPRWVLPALQIDLLRQRRTSGRLSERIVTRAEIVSAFNEFGLDPIFTMDVATSWDAVPTVNDGDSLPALPTNVDFIISPKGNFRALDRGQLDLGVRNNIVRDNDSNARNQFTMFWESWEGLMDFGAVSYGMTIEGVCLGGAQTADVTAITCPAGSGS